jgi:hypothetical protein
MADPFDGIDRHLRRDKKHGRIPGHQPEYEKKDRNDRKENENRMHQAPTEEFQRFHIFSYLQ